MHFIKSFVHSISIFLKIHDIGYLWFSYFFQNRLNSKTELQICFTFKKDRKILLNIKREKDIIIQDALAWAGWKPGKLCSIWICTETGCDWRKVKEPWAIWDIICWYQALNHQNIPRFAFLLPARGIMCYGSLKSGFKYVNFWTSQLCVTINVEN